MKDFLRNFSRQFYLLSEISTKICREKAAVEIFRFLEIYDALPTRLRLLPLANTRALQLFSFDVATGENCVRSTQSFSCFRNTTLLHLLDFINISQVLRTHAFIHNWPLRHFNQNYHLALMSCVLISYKSDGTYLFNFFRNSVAFD